MEEYLYRYIGFDTLVDMVQSQALTFVLPCLWEDPKELLANKIYMKSHDIIPDFAMKGIMDKTYAQCWTKLQESDAMWRIYSYSNKSVRIKAKRNSFYELDSQIEIRDVLYIDEMDKVAEAIDEKKDLWQLWAVKRKAFEHESEVRVILPYRYPNDESIHEHIKAYVAFYTDDSSQRVRFIDSFKKGSLKENINYAITLTNVNKRVCMKKLSFRGHPTFIQGVMVHPLAPDWYVSMVKRYCELNEIPFEGKSTLYQE